MHFQHGGKGAGGREQGSKEETGSNHISPHIGARERNCIPLHPAPFPPASFIKFAAAIICIALCSLNVVAAVKRTPIRTTLEGSTRTTIEMMPSPNSSIHWLSAAIFIAGFACFISWGIADYNDSLEGEENHSNITDSYQNIVPETSQTSPSINPVISGQNIIQFTPRLSANLEPESQTLSPEEFYSQLQQEDYWKDKEDTNNNPSAS